MAGIGLFEFRRKFYIRYLNEKVGKKLLAVLVDCFSNMPNNSLLNYWIDTVKLLLKGSHRNGKINISIYDYFDKNYTKLAIKMDLNVVVADNLKEKEEKIMKSLKNPYYYSYYSYSYVEKVNFYSEMEIIFDKRINFSQLRKMIYEKFLKDEEIYRYIIELDYNCYSIIQIMESNTVSVNILYGHRNYNIEKNIYETIYEFVISGSFRDENIRKEFPVKHSLRDKMWWSREKFYKIQELVRDYLDKYKQNDNRIPFRMIREALRINKRIKRIIKLRNELIKSLKDLGISL